MVPFSLQICVSFVNKKNPLLLYERDCFWLASKELKTSFPLWFYAVTFFVTVQRPLGNVTLSKTFSPYSIVVITKGLIVEGKMN